MQALVRGTYYFIGNGCGSLLGGYLIDENGGGTEGYHYMFWFGAFAMGSWSLSWHLLMCLDKARKALCIPTSVNTSAPEAAQPLRSSLVSPLLSTEEF